MATAQGGSHATVQRIWDAHGLQPHRATTFKLSTDPAFVEKLTDIVGLYMNPPEKAVVLCVDEKSQIQALDRTQPGLPMKKGRCGTFTHDYKRHGTTTLFAALSMLDGTVIGECHGRHRHQEFLEFLRQLHRELMSIRGQSLRALLAPFRERYFISGEINTTLDDHRLVADKLDALASRYADGHVYRMDGVSVEYPTWHFNVRPSNTEPLLRLNLEGNTQDEMAARRDEVLALIRD